MHSGYLRAEIFRTLSNIDKLLDKLDSLEYYSDNPKKIIDVFKSFTRTLQDNFDAIPAKKHYYTVLLQSLNYSFIPLLRYISRSQTSEIPWSLIPNVQKIIEDLVGNNHLILIRPQWHWNYSVLITDIIEYLNQLLLHLTLNANIKIESPPIHVISFPYLEKNNFLLHSIIGHELGHFIQHEYFRTYFNTEWDKKKLNETMKNIVEKQDRMGELFKLNSTIKLSEIAQEIISIYKGFVREIIPDIVGYLIFGPSQLFTLYFMTAWNEDNIPPLKKNDYYPPLKYRIRILNDTFFANIPKKENDNKYYEIMGKLDNDIRTYLQDTNDTSGLNDNDSSEMAFKYFQEDLPFILNYLKGRVGDNKFQPDSEKIDILISKIQDDIPPNEINNVPVTLAELFLSGWLFFYSNLETMNESSIKKDVSQYISDFSIISKLLLKASTSISIHSYYIKQKDS